ncbi:MAG: hypothetical protein II787_02905, partial [Lachnospiraceae bacterium]|nr:hypothetical protein [Lachnospiraceae bacterium]
YKPNTVRMPQVTLVLDGKTLVEDQDYYVYYWNNEEAGQAEITIRGTGGYTGYVERYFTIKKAKQPMRITARKPAVKAAALAKKAQKIKKTKAFRITKAKGKVTFKKRSGSSKRLTISKAGVITVKKGTKKGTYKIRVRATARGNSNYRKGYKNVTVKVRVK